MAKTVEVPKTAKTRARKKSLLKDREFLIPVLSALGAVAVVVLGVIFVPKIMAIPLDEENVVESEEAYAAYRKLYEEAKSFNYAYGGDVKLENEIKRAVESDTINTAGYFYYIMAAAEYYYGVRDLDRAIAFAAEAENYAPTDLDWEDVVDFYIKAYKKQGDEESLAYWQQVYDDYHAEPENCDTSDEETLE